MIPDFRTVNKMFIVLQLSSIKPSKFLLFSATRLSYSFPKLYYQNTEQQLKTASSRILHWMR